MPIVAVHHPPGRIPFEVAPNADWPGDWLVEAIDHPSEGEIYQANFSGTNAEARAREYAAWKNSLFTRSPGGTGSSPRNQ